MYRIILSYNRLEKHDWDKIEKIKQITATDSKWIWVHKNLICILCLTLMALWLLKYAHEAGNIWIAHNDVEIYMERSLGIRVYISAQSTQLNISRGQRETLTIHESYSFVHAENQSTDDTSRYLWISARQCLKQSKWCSCFCFNLKNPNRTICRAQKHHILTCTI